MEDTSGFYKIDGELLYAKNGIMHADYSLMREDYLNYEYPIDGWYWFNSEIEAEEFFMPTVAKSLQQQIDELKRLNESSVDRITKYQATKWLRDTGLYDTVMQMIDGDQDAKDRWTLSPVLMRNDPIVQAMGQMLGLSDEQLREAFSQASLIT
jgi:hypothetical protein